jgi:hypothetical protein
MGAAVADTSCLAVGTLIAGALQQWRRVPAAVPARG